MLIMFISGSDIVENVSEFSKILGAFDTATLTS